MLKRMNLMSLITLSRMTCLTAALATLIIAPFQANATSLVHVQWESLSTVIVGKTVSIAMPEGAVITGKAKGVESDALLVDVKSTTDAKTYPKGLLRRERRCTASTCEPSERCFGLWVQCSARVPG